MPNPRSRVRINELEPKSRDRSNHQSLISHYSIQRTISQTRGGDAADDESIGPPSLRLDVRSGFSKSGSGEGGTGGLGVAPQVVGPGSGLQKPPLEGGMAIWPQKFLQNRKNR